MVPGWAGGTGYTGPGYLLCSSSDPCVQCRALQSYEESTPTGPVCRVSERALLSNQYYSVTIILIVCTINC